MLNGDVKLENILVSDNFKIKICDLGTCKSIEDAHEDKVGSTNFMAPEVFEGKY